MSTLRYQTITGRELDLGNLNPEERNVLAAVHKKYGSQPEWTAFGSWWVGEFERSVLDADSVVYRICQDLEARLGIAQGKVAPPDYRDYLADLIEEQYGSRYRFCKATGIDPGQLSRVFANRADLSLPTLQKIMEALRAALVVQAQDRLYAQISPEEANRTLAGAMA